MCGPQSYGQILLQIGSALYLGKLSLLITTEYSMTFVHAEADFVCLFFFLRSNNCKPGTEVIFITARNSKVNIRHDDDVRSVRCEGTRD